MQDPPCVTLLEDPSSSRLLRDARVYLGIKTRPVDANARENISAVDIPKGTDSNQIIGMGKRQEMREVVAHWQRILFANPSIYH